MTQLVKAAEKPDKHILVELASVSMGCGTPAPRYTRITKRGTVSIQDLVYENVGCPCQVNTVILKCHLRSRHGVAHPAFRSSRSSPMLGVQGCLGVQETRANNRILNLLRP